MTSNKTSPLKLTEPASLVMVIFVVKQLFSIIPLIVQEITPREASPAAANISLALAKPTSNTMPQIAAVNISPAAPLATAIIMPARHVPVQTEAIQAPVTMMSAPTLLTADVLAIPAELLLARKNAAAIRQEQLA